MKKNKGFKDLGVRDRMIMSESLGAKVATIVNKARERCNKILQLTGYGVNINVDFYRLDAPIQDNSTNEEVTSG